MNGGLSGGLMRKEQHLFFVAAAATAVGLILPHDYTWLSQCPRKACLSL